MNKNKFTKEAVFADSFKINSFKEAFFKDFVREIISLLVESQHVSFSVSFDIETTISFNLINDTIETWKTWALSMINEIERLYELNIQRQDELKQRLKEIKELKAMIKA